MSFSYESSLSLETELLDLSKVDLDDDETWLYKPSIFPKTELESWLSNNEIEVDLQPKNIDTRTFTRPSKRFIRPSIQKYNEELYGDLQELSDSGIQINGGSQDDSPQEPVHFNLGQSISSRYFDPISVNPSPLDLLQNMSPPSLVNSMCSSTFATLMDSSFIKNDPELRQIRDTDFTSIVLQQEEEPMFHSITESFSSLNSDVPENFLKKVSFIGNDVTVIKDCTFTKEDVPCDQTLTEDLNSTYQKNSVLNSTYPLAQTENDKTIIVNPVEPKPVLEKVKRLLNRRSSPSPDLNRISYLVERTENSSNQNSKRNSFGSTDSENLDYMSLSSSSSKISERIQSMEEINSVGHRAFSPKRNSSAQSLQQIMSTPKGRISTPWDYHEISPILDCNSDSDLSSNEFQVIENDIRKQIAVDRKSGNPVSRSNTVTLKGSHPNLRKIGNLAKESNLNSMARTLKGSYTSLRPTMNRNLPVAPPLLDSTVTVVKEPIIAQVPPVPREVPKTDNAQFVKPQAPRSCLPRPVTGIPRPVSRIPGPRTIRPVSKSADYQGRL